MLTGRGGDDRRVLKLAVAMERVLTDLDSARRERPAARPVRHASSAPCVQVRPEHFPAIPYPEPAMIVIHSQDLTDTERHARGPGWKAGA